MRKRSVKTKLLIQLRRLGMLCKKQTPHKYELKIAHTVYPDTIISPLEAARHVFIQNKLAITKGCYFNPDTESCRCGNGVDEFLNGCENKMK